MKHLSNYWNKFTKMHWTDHGGIISLIFAFYVLIWSYSVVGEFYVI